MKLNVTRKDVADRAGVSVSVVSRALNNSGYVEQNKKDTILRIAKELDYVPNPVAMSLQQKRTRQIIFYCKDLNNSFYIGMYFGMLSEAKARNYVMMINGDMDFANIKGMITDGIILQSDVFAAEYISYYGKNYFLPVVCASFGDMQSLSVTVPTVEWDLYSSMEFAIHYLKKRGHRRIAYAGPYPYDSGDARTRCWKNAMETVFEDQLRKYYLSIEGEPERDVAKTVSGLENIDEYYLEKGKTVGREFLEKKPDVSAVICFNDEFAVGFISQLEFGGKKIPDDISIMSFDGTIRRKTMAPEITSVTPDPEDMGKKLANLLMDRIEGKKIHYYSRQNIHIAEGASVRTV